MFYCWAKEAVTYGRFHKTLNINSDRLCARRLEPYQLRSVIWYKTGNGNHLRFITHLPENNSFNSMAIDIDWVVLCSDEAILHQSVSKRVNSIPIWSPGEDLNPSDLSFLISPVWPTQQDGMECRVDDRYSHNFHTVGPSNIYWPQQKNLKQCNILVD